MTFLKAANAAVRQLVAVSRHVLLADAHGDNAIIVMVAELGDRQ